ncbi:MAG: hypothetical protein AB1597_03905 [Chloroflexota bacterium]
MGEAKDARKMEKLEKLYAIAMSSGQTPPPKKSLFAAKCPKCGAKLNKESVKELIVGVEGESAFVNKVIAEAQLTPGAYYLAIDHYTCPNGDYEFAKRSVEELGEGA